MNERELPEVEPQIETVDPVDQVLDLLRDDETAAAIALVTDMRSPDAAEVLEHLSSDDLEEIIPSLDAETISGAIEYADSSTRSEIVRLLETDTLTETIAAVPDDIATDLVHELGGEGEANPHALFEDALELPCMATLRALRLDRACTNHPRLGPTLEQAACGPSLRRLEPSSASSCAGGSSRSGSGFGSCWSIGLCVIVC